MKPNGINSYKKLWEYGSKSSCICLDGHRTQESFNKKEADWRSLPGGYIEAEERFQDKGRVYANTWGHVHRPECPDRAES